MAKKDGSSKSNSKKEQLKKEYKSLSKVPDFKFTPPPPKKEKDGD
jgi:hypothetical protein